MLASSLDAIITIDHEGRVVEFNRAAEQMFGPAAEEAVGARAGRARDPARAARAHRAALRRYVETGESTLLGQRIELTGMRADGSEFPVELAINRIAGAEPPMFTGTVRDITQRSKPSRSARSCCASSSSRASTPPRRATSWRRSSSGVADAVTAQAPDGRLLFANDAAVDLLGFESLERAARRRR